MKWLLLALAIGVPEAAMAQLPPADLRSDNLKALEDDLNRRLQDRAIRIGFSIGAAARCGYNRRNLEELIGLMRENAANMPGDGKLMDAFTTAMESMADFKVTDVAEFCDAAKKGLEYADKSLRNPEFRGK